MLVKEIYNIAKQKLSVLYDKRECESIIRLLFESILDFQPHTLYINLDKEVSVQKHNLLAEAIEKLSKFCPLQYILGKANFYDLEFVVNSSVLIPRPETEELVDLIIKKHKKDYQYSILDIGTGSGCIAVSLKKHLPNSKVYAIDISKPAIEIAKLNAKNNNVEIEFHLLDINEKTFDGKFDIIVSNPPYIRDSEKILMKSNVLDYEPEDSLFVPDEDPLIFYKSIKTQAINHLKRGGRLYLEINEAFGKEMIDLFSGTDFTNVKLKNDLNGKNRFLIVNRSFL